jgi:hypothetical protein
MSAALNPTLDLSCWLCSKNRRGANSFACYRKHKLVATTVDPSFLATKSLQAAGKIEHCTGTMPCTAQTQHSRRRWIYNYCGSNFGAACVATCRTSSRINTWTRYCCHHA